MWTIEQITFELLDDMSDDPVATLRVRTPAGVILFVAEPLVFPGNRLMLNGTHAQAERANAIGAANLMVIVRAVMEGMGFDELVIEGSVRTTGARPGHRPRLLRFTRHNCPPPGPRH